MLKQNPAIIYLIIAAVIWGATVPVMKVTLREIPIFSLIVIRMASAAILLLPFAIKRSKIQKQDIKNLFLSAVFGTNLNLAFFFYGLEHSQAINASVILSTTPIFTLFAAHIFLKEKLNFKLISGASLAFLGTLVIIGIPAFGKDMKSTLGDLSLLMSAFAWVLHEIYAKRSLKKYHFITVSFYTMLIGAILFSPIAALELLADPSWINEVSLQGLLGLMFGIFFASLTAYTAWQKGLAETTATLASFVFYLLPITGIIFSVVLLKETFSIYTIFGTIFVVLGIILAESHRKSKHLQN